MFHVTPSVRWGCLTICHPATWTDTLQPISSCCHGLPPRSSIAPLRLHLTPRGPRCRPELRPSQCLIRMGKECWASASSCPCQPVNVSPPLAHICKFATVLTPPRYPTDSHKDIWGERLTPTFPPPLSFFFFYISWMFCHPWLKPWIRNENGGCLFSARRGKLSAQQTLMTPGCHYRVAYRLWKHLQADARC